jgi:hypothetical protein
MPTDKLYPAYVNIDYHSQFGTHNMTLCMREITTTGIGDPGTLLAWDESTIAADVMVEALIDLMGAAVPSTITFDAYTLYRVPTVGADPQPIYTAAPAVVGSLVGLTGQAKAVQVTVGFKTANFGDARIVFLDRPVNGSFGSFSDPGAEVGAVGAEFMATSNAWAGRDNFRPAVLTNVSITLNKRLRRKYGMI